MGVFVKHKQRAKVRKIGKEMRRKGVYLCFLVIYCIFL